MPELETEETTLFMVLIDITNQDSSMGTSGGEPRILLNALKPMLGITGDIKTPQEVMRIVGLMKDAEKLMSRCIYLNILKSTCLAASENELKAETMERFLSVGGWGVLNKWLSEFIKTENYPVLLELIEVLRCLPVTVELLKQGNTGKLIKQMTKLNNSDVKKNAALLIRKWKNMIRGDSGDKRQVQEAVNGEKSSGESNKKDEVEAANKRQRELQGSSIDIKGQPPEKKMKTGPGKQLPKIKLIDPLANKAAIESRGFLDSIMSVAQAPIRKKKKAATSKTSSIPTTPPIGSKPIMPLDEILNNRIADDSRPEGTSSPSSSPLRADSPNAPQLLEKSECAVILKSTRTLSISIVADEQENESGPSPESNIRESIDEDSIVSKNAEAIAVVTLLGALLYPTLQKCPVSVEGKEDDEKETTEPPSKRVKHKKSVTWPNDNDLTEVFFFELDEEERAMMHHSANFLAAKQLELMRERKILEQARRLSEDKMTEKIAWTRPRIMDIGPPPCEPGEKSNEKYVQIEREQKVLADIFLTKASLPDSPAEPDFDPEDHGRVEPRVIPHDEDGTIYPNVHPTPQPATSAAQYQQTGNNVQQNYVPSSGAPVTNAPSTVSQYPDDSMSPAVKNIMNQIMVNKPPQSEQPDQFQNFPSHGPSGPRPPGPDGPHNFHPGNHGPPGPVSNGPRPLLSMRLPDQRRGNFRGRPAAPRGGQRGGGPRGGGGGGAGAGGGGAGGGPRPRFQVPPPRGGNREEHYDYEDDYHGEPDEDYGRHQGHGHGGRGPSRGPRGRHPSNQGRERGPGPNAPPNRGRGRGGGRDPVCRHFMSNRGCRNGNSCTFLHPGVNGPPL